MIRKFLFTLFILFGAAGAHGSTMEAEELIRVTTDKLLGEFSANRSAYEADHESLYEMVNRIAVPHFDFRLGIWFLKVAFWFYLLYDLSVVKVSYSL